MNAVWFLSYVGMFFIGVITTLFGLYLLVSYEEKQTEKDILAAMPPPDPQTRYSMPDSTNQPLK